MKLFEVKVLALPEVQMLMARDIGHLILRLTARSEYLILRSYELSPDWDSKHFTEIKWG